MGFSSVYATLLEIFPQVCLNFDGNTIFVYQFFNLDSDDNHESSFLFRRISAPFEIEYV